jgi:predicted dehydrogenase
MRIAVIGCGFVADFYMQSLPVYPELQLVAIADRDPVRLAAFAAHHGLTCTRSVEAILADPGIELILNLTNPDSHYEISKLALGAGKHVYSEKPLAMRFEDALELTELADSKGLHLACAPCSLLGETAQTLWKALREQQVGKMKLVYAEMDDGMVFLMPYRKWLSASGRPWPSKDEFEVGCTLEHAGYYVTWLTAFFGPAVSVTAFAACLHEDKYTDEPLARSAPDVSVACIEFKSGVVARLTCTIVAHHDHQIRFFGEKGTLSTEDCWSYYSPVKINRFLTVRRKMIVSPLAKRVPLVSLRGTKRLPRGANQMQFCRGPAEVAAAIAEQRACRMSNEFCLHNNEVVLAIQNAASGAVQRMRTTFKVAPQPMELA